jgi:FtsP/CotA-like multicopper oxidase with cupredoxin domain
MTKQTTITRRSFIWTAGLSMLGLVAGKITHYQLGQRVLANDSFVPDFVPDVEINLISVPTTVPILNGQETAVWQFQGTLVQGEPGNLITLPDTYLGPIIHLRTGQNVRVNFTNNLAEPTIVHWHGLHVPHEADGHPSQIINNGETYVYEFTVMDQAGTYWYHPHPHGRTAPQAYMGLAGLFLISDDAEDGMGLPTGNYDLPQVIQDRTFDANNQLVYSTSMTGFLGDQICVNGQPNAIQTVENTLYRLRFLNGSNSRIYKLAWADNTPLTAIGTDGGLLDTAVQRDYITMSPGERVELLVNFNQWGGGNSIELRSLAFTPGGGGGGTLPNGSEFLVTTFEITDGSLPPTATPTATATATATATPVPGMAPEAFLPAILKENISSTHNQVNQPQVADRIWSLYVQQGQWTINGRVWQGTAVAADEIVQLGAQEIWEFDNNSPLGMGMGLPHPMHLHGLQYQVVARIPPADPTQYNNWLTVKDGYVDDGRKDTVLVMPGERVQIAVHFEDFTGLYLYHCHNLEHEDMGMMRNYRVDAPA